MRKTRFLVVLFFILLIGSSAFYFLGNFKSKERKIDVVSPSAFEVIDEAFHIIREEAVHQIEGEALIEGALRGMADVVDDPYSTYLTKEEAVAHRESLASERVGIGAEITRSNGKFIIVAPLKSSPADKAGLQPYDEIVQIDKESVAGFTLQQLVDKIRGKKGTTLQLTIYRPDMNKHLEVSVVRDTIPVKTVENEVISSKNRQVGYISIMTFGEETAAEWEVATDAVIGNRSEALVIDVRGNPGGYLYSVSEIVSSLVKEETIFAFMEDAKGALTPLLAEDSTDSNFNEKLKNIPIVLLQDEGSASASEVLSAALQDAKRSIIIGTNSFGKGTVQDIFDLSNGGEMKLSTHKWLTPKEKWIHGEGVTPDIKVQPDPIFNVHTRLVTEVYERNDYHDDIAYSQKLLKNLGYSIKRDDGYFDKSTEIALLDFRKETELKSKPVMDRDFYQALKEEVEVYRTKKENDLALKMALDYLVHELEK